MMNILCGKMPESLWSLICASTDLTPNGALIFFRHGTVTSCFNDAAISVTLLAHAVSTAWSLGELSNSDLSRLPRNWRLKLRRYIAFFLMAIPVFYLVIVQLFQGHELPVLRYVSVVLTIVVWSYHLAYYLQHKRKDELHITFSSVLLMIWSALRSYSLLNELSRYTEADTLSYYVELYGSLLSTFLLLIYTCLTVRPWTSVPSPVVSMNNVLAPSLSDGYVQFPELEEESGVLSQAEEYANWLSLLSFWWVGRLMRRGFQGTLNQPHDLFDLPCGLHADELALRYAQLSPGRSLFFKVHCLLGGRFYVLGIMKLVCDVCTFTGPMLLNKLISCFEDNPDVPVRYHAYAYATILAATAYLSALLITHYNYQVEKIKLKLKTTLVLIIYQKSLNVGLTGRSFMSGNALNLMTSDVDRVANFCTSFHMFWSLPLQIIVTLYMLYTQVGISFLAGAAFVVSMIPINRYLANRINNLSEKMMEAKDRRISLLREILRGILYIKMHSWTELFQKKIQNIRREEMRQLRGRKFIDAWCVFFWATTPVLVSVMTFVTWSITGKNPASLSAAQVFTTISLFNLLIMPLNAFPWVLNAIVEAKVSLARMEYLMKMEDFAPDSYYAETAGDPDVVLRFTSAEFAHQSYDEEDIYNFKLGPITLTLKKGEFLGVFGEVGSGKSSFFSAILGGMNRVGGNLEFSHWNRPVAFVSQRVWLQKTTIRDNVIFGQLFDTAVYNAVLEACVLDEDIKGFPDGDLTDVGEEGSRLSGGQRMRVSLARAAYCALINPNEAVLVLLDDPFLSLDVHVANRIYSSCICGLLANSTRILATHHTRLLYNCTAILNLHAGQCIGYGPPEEILPKARDIRARGGSLTVTPESEDKILPVLTLEAGQENHRRGSLSLDVLWFYVRSIGLALFICTVAAVALMQVSRTSVDAWLAYYVSTSRSRTSTNMYNTPSWMNTFFIGYVSLAIVSSILTLIRAFLFAYAGLRGAVKVHDSLILRVLYAPITFFEQTPLGQVLNRLSSDVHTVDESLPFIANILFAQSFSLAGTILVACYGLPWILLLLLPLSMSYASVQRYYRWTSRELKRLFSVTLSPLYSHLSESFAGTTIIRAFSASPKFVHQLHISYKNTGPVALNDVSFDLPAGQRLGVVGRTGAGKSSLVQALFRLRPLKSGVIRIDGLDLSMVPSRVVRERLACIPQEAFVFVGSMRDNLDPRHEHTDHNLWSALTTCSMNVTVQQNGGLDGFRIEEHGANLSMGQRQLVCLARAILRKARVLCMDEATSGVDMETEKMVQRTLASNALRGTTVIYIAHRVQTVVESCDLVAVMSKGKIVQFGVPSELSSVEGPFKDLLNGNY
ncbi:multidrug resistance-associated protein 7-like isoform X3 [Varroa jacobsoni]|uniref:multidrug resistance-associated protein 7-like isoform X3 n=1 Tax=Varroa jacobsoni TaxID=62625 RepID=UPI000BF7D2D8|nr:multidrug resistance-associated protein 7-like isoform X3 [Varroa jacobsoni]